MKFSIEVHELHLYKNFVHVYMCVGRGVAGGMQGHTPAESHVILTWSSSDENVRSGPLSTTGHSKQNSCSVYTWSRGTQRKKDVLPTILNIGIS